jgi:drug/metabolite transporter (DMT)-like permease
VYIFVQFCIEIILDHNSIRIPGMISKRNSKSKTAIIAVFVGMLQPSSPLRSSLILPIRRVGRSTSINRQPRARADTTIRGTTRTWRSTTCVELSNSPFDDFDCDVDNSTSTTTSIATATICASNDDDNGDTTTSMLSDDVGDSDLYFDVNDSKASSSISENMTQREEIPPISILLLNFVAVIWGTQHAITKMIVDDSDPAAYTFLRFGLASIIASPFLPGIKDMFMKMTKKFDSIREDNDDEKSTNVELWKPWRWGIEMGLWMFLGFSLQAIGLQSTTAQRSGFLLYLNVKFVPFFAYVFLGRKISANTWILAFAAFSGTALLALDGQSIGFNEGDCWSILAAAASAMFILRLEKASIEVPNSAELNATSLFVVAILSGVWLMLSSASDSMSIVSELTEIVSAHPLELLYLGGISTALANFIQAKAQKDVPAERASIIYSLDPVYGAFFSWIFLGETLGGPQAYIGASIIFVAAATNSLVEFSKEEEKGV